MNRAEILKILAVLQTAYPNFYKSISPEQLNGTINLWQEMLSDDTYEEVGVAVKMLISTKTDAFPPVVGQIKEQLYKSRNAGQLSESEAWSLVYNAVQQGSYHSKEAFEQLPEVVRQAVGSPEVIRQWAMENTDSLSVHESNFKRAYRMQLETKKELDMLPEALKKQINLLAEQKQMKLIEEVHNGVE